MEPADNKTYIRETIEKPRTPFWKKLLLTVFLALVFGAVAAITFVFGKTLASRFVTTEEKETAESVFFPPDDPGRDESDTASGSAAQSTAETEAEPSEPSSTAPEETADETKNLTEELQAMVAGMLAADQPDISDVSLLYRAAASLVSRAGNSLVTVTVARKGTDAFGTEYSYDEQSFGVIIAVTSREVLILTPYGESGVSDGSLSVRFVTGDVSDAYTKSTDRISGMTMLAVALRGMDEKVKITIAPIELGNSFNYAAGQPVIALGAPAAANGSVRYGILTYISKDVAAVDNTIRLLHTDMGSLSGSCGFLIDLDGKLIGWFDEPLAENGFITAVGISDIKGYLQNLSNSLSTAYLGITGQTLTNEMKDLLGVSESGVYILSCIDDGPAMLAGLMNGDIIISISGEPIAGVIALRTKLLDMNIEQTVKITVLRGTSSGYQPLDFDVHLERR